MRIAAVLVGGVLVGAALALGAHAVLAGPPEDDTDGIGEIADPRPAAEPIRMVTAPESGPAGGTGEGAGGPGAGTAGQAEPAVAVTPAVPEALPEPPEPVLGAATVLPAAGAALVVVIGMLVLRSQAVRTRRAWAARHVQVVVRDRSTRR